MSSLEIVGSDAVTEYLYGTVRSDTDGMSLSDAVGRDAMIGSNIGIYRHI